MGYRTPRCTLQTPLRILLKHCSLFVQAHDTLIIRHPEPLCSSTVFLTSSLRIIISFSKLPLLSHRIHFRGSAPLSLSTSLVSPKAYISRETWLICSFIYIDFFFFLDLGPRLIEGYFQLSKIHHAINFISRQCPSFCSSLSIPYIVCPQI